MYIWMWAWRVGQAEGELVMPCVLALHRLAFGCVHVSAAVPVVREVFSRAEACQHDLHVHDFLTPMTMVADVFSCAAAAAASALFAALSRRWTAMPWLVCCP